MLLVVGMPRTPHRAARAPSTGAGNRRARAVRAALRARRGAAVVLSPRRRGGASLPRDRPVRCALHGARIRLPAAAERGGWVPRDRRARRGAAGRAGKRRVAARRADRAARRRRPACAPWGRLRCDLLVASTPGTPWPRRPSGCTGGCWRTSREGGRDRVLGVGGADRLHARWLSAAARRPCAVAAPPAVAGRGAAARVARDRGPRRAGGDRGEGEECARARLSARPAGGDRGLGRLDGRHRGACARRGRRGLARAGDGPRPARQGARAGCRRGRGVRRGPGVLGRERALGARRAPGPGAPVLGPGGRLRLRVSLLPRARRLQSGGCLLALRERGPGAREPARVGDGRQRRDLRGAARARTCAWTRAPATTCRFPSTW